MLRSNRAAASLTRHLGPATPIASDGNVVELHVDIAPPTPRKLD
jgi:hypothetical protein